MKIRKACIGALLVAGWALTTDARAAELPLAAQVLKETGVSAGLAVVVGTTDGNLEAELTNGGRMLVQGLALLDEAAVEARQYLFGQKLYGLVSVTRVHSARTLPYYDRLVNLLVADLDGLGSNAPSINEIMRVLGYEGVAYLKLDGKWTKTVKPTSSEVDSWGHYAYDASQNPVSKDLVVGPPNAARWIDGPFGMNLVGGLRTSDGVAVQINPAYLLKDSKTKIPPKLEGLHLWARDVNSGVLLWHRPILNHRRCKYGRTYANTFVAAGGRVYAYDFTGDDQVALTAWNLRDGTVERVFDHAVVCRKADWPGGEDKKADWLQWASDTFDRGMVLVHEGKVVQMVKDKLFVMDAVTGDVMWKRQMGGGTNFLRVLIAGDRLVALVARIGLGARQGRKMDVVALEAWHFKDGKPMWRVDLSGSTFPSGHADDTFLLNVAAREPYLLLPLEGRLLLLDARDGSKIWEKPRGGMIIGYFMIKDKIWRGHVGSNPFGGVISLTTGERDTTPRKGGLNQSACDGPTATLNWFMGKRNFVPVERQPDWPHWVSLRCMGKKCGERAAASYGSIYGLSPHCGCDQFIRGTGAFYAIPPTPPVPDDRRLASESAEAIGPLVSQDEARKSLLALFWGRPEGAPSLWYTTNFRWGEKMYHWPGYGLTQTPPVEADELTLQAHVHEHRLAVRRGSEEIWNFVAGGRIGSPPVIHRGRAIFGSHDGYVYAVNLNDGTLAWRFLAAPADRRHVVLGQVESVWPVFNVVIENGKLYCSAGRHEEFEGGIHFYCLDAATGTIQWHVKRRRGLESDLAPIRQRKNTGDDRGTERLQRGILSDGRAHLNDTIELRDGQICLHGVPVVDITTPKDVVVYPQTLVPPQLRK